MRSLATPGALISTRFRMARIEGFRGEMIFVRRVDLHADRRAIVRRPLAALPPGSYLAVRDGTGTGTDPAYREAWCRARCGGRT